VTGVMQQLRGYNVVSIGYCSSDSWIGEGGDGRQAAGFPNPNPKLDGFQFNGRRILEATLAQLSARHGLADARRVLIGGCSAGGRGALYNLDHACARVRALAREAAGGAEGAPPICEGLVDAGWWTEGEPTAAQRARGVPSLVEVAQASFALYGPKGGVCGQCTSLTARAPSHCLFGRVCAQHTRSSFFLAQSQYGEIFLSESWYIRTQF
jgi:hypothetical protein